MALQFKAYFCASMQEREADIRPEILKKAGEIFALKGIADTKMIDIANALEDQ